MLKPLINSIANSAKRAIGTVSPFASPSAMPRAVVQAPRQLGPAMPELIDPTNPESEISPADLVHSTPPPSAEDTKKIIALVEGRVKTARTAQMAHHSRWYTSWSFYLGEQWRTWNGSTGMWQNQKQVAGDAMYSKDFPRRYRTFNAIAPLIEHTQSKALESDPSPGFAPLTPSQQDQEAAKEARAVDSHLSRLYDLPSLQADAVEWALQVAAPCMKVYYDKSKTYLKPVYGPDGQLQSVTDAPGGEINMELLSPFEWMGDPKAKRAKKMAWVVHYQIVPLSYVQSNFARGWYVKPDAQMSDVSGVEARQAIITGDNNRNNNGKMDGVALAEYWEVASARYPKGRVITVANGELLDYQEQHPDGDGKSLPFFVLDYHKTLASIYGRNAAYDLVDSQVLTNKVWSRFEERIDESTYFISAAEGSEPDIDLARSDRLKTIYFYKAHDAVTNNPLPEPHFEQTPPMPQEFAEIAQFADTYRRDRIGIHDISDGAAPTGVTSGIALQTLKAGDDTQLANFVKHIRSWRVDIAQCAMEIAQAKYLEPRLLMVQDTEELAKDAPRSEVMDFKALAKGRVVVSSSSATTQSPLVRQQIIHDMQAGGAFSPEQLPFTRVMLKIYGIEGADKLYDDLGVVLDQEAAKQKAMQPDPAQVQQQQAAAQAQQAQEQQMHEAALLHVQTEAKIQIMQAEAQIANDQLKLKEQLETERIAHQLALDHQHEETMAKIAADAQIALAQYKFEHPQLTAAADPTAVVGIEKEIGLEGEVPAVPEPATNTGASK